MEDVENQTATRIEQLELFVQTGASEVDMEMKT